MLTITHLSGFNAFTPASGVVTYVNSVQHFAITIAAGATTGTATISSVDTSRSFIAWGGQTAQSGATDLAREAFAYLQLTDATTVTATRNTSDASDSVTVHGSVVACAAAFVSSVQQGTISMSTLQTTNTATISSVDTARAAVLYLGVICNLGNDNLDAALQRVTLTNATTVTANRHVASAASAALAYVVVEFASGVVDSLQQRSVTLTSGNASDTDTITSVDTANTVLFFGGASVSNNTFSNSFYSVALTNGTTVTLARTGTNTGTRTINYTAVEFVPGIIDSLQRNATAVASATSADASINAVTTSKAWCHQIGFSTTAAVFNEALASAKLLDADSVRCEKDTAGSTTSTPSWEVAEFN